MANIYVRSGAGGAANGTAWADAYLTIAAALAATPGASDTIWVADDHSESTAGNLTLNFTPFGLKVLCADTHVTEPPTGLATTAVVTVSGTSSVTVQGSAYVYGIQFKSSTSANNASDITINDAATTNGSLVLESCAMVMQNTGSGANIHWGGGIANTSPNIQSRVRLIDCTVKFGATTQSIMLRSGVWHIRNLILDASGSAPTTLLKPLINATGIYTFRNCDLSTLAWTNLIDQTVALPSEVTVMDSKLPGGVTIATGTHSGPGGLIFRMHNCDSADTHIRYAEHSYQGSVVQQTGTRVLTATQADAVTHAILMTGSGNATVSQPLYSPDIVAMNTATGAPVTATVEILRDNATNLTDAEVWLEVFYYGTAGTPIGSFISDRCSTIITTPADQTGSSASWDTTGMTNANKQKLAVTFTPREAGYVRARVALVPNTSVYVDPTLTIA